MTVIAKHLVCDMRDICSMCSIYLWPPKTEPRFYYYCPTCKRDILCDRGLVNTFEYDENNMATGTKPLCLNCRSPVEDRWWPEGSAPEQPDFSEMVIETEAQITTPPQESTDTPQIHLDLPPPGKPTIPPTSTTTTEAKTLENRAQEPAIDPDLPVIPAIQVQSNTQPSIPDPMNVSNVMANKNRTCPNCGALLPFKAKKCPNCQVDVS